MADNNQMVQSGTRSNSAALRLHIAGRQQPTLSADGSNANSQKTYELNTGDKTYTLNQSQIDWMRQAHINSWADAYAFDDDDQQRKAAGIAPRSYERNYKNTRLDNWLYENKLPSTKYLDKYLEAYDQYETERKEYESKAKQKSDLYAAAAVSSVDLELKGIYNDDKMYNWTDADGNDIVMSGKDIHENAFFDALNSGQYGDFTGRYVFDDSDIEKTEADFESAADWREYQLKQSQKAFDLQNNWDDATSISYDDYLKNYKDAYDKQIKAQKIVGDEFGRTYGDAISDNERIRQSEAYGALTTRNAVDAFLESSQDDPADIIRNMYEYGVDQSLINRARKNLEKSARSDEERDAIRDAYDFGNATGSIQSIFSSHLDGGRNYTKKNAEAARAEAKAAGYTDEQIDAAGKQYADARNRSYSGAWDREADDIVRYGSTEAADRVRAENTENKNDRRDADKLLADVAEKYESGQIDLSTMSADEAANRILAALEYEGNSITSDSLKSAVDGLLSSGASYQVLKSATDKIIPMISRVNVVDSGNRTVASSPITAKSIISDALDSARQADRTALAEAYRQSAMENGMSAYDVDQALRRAGFSDAISDEEAAKNYYIEVDLPRALESDSSWETVKAAYPDITPEQYAADVWNQMTDEERAEYTEAFASSKLYNVDLHRTYGEQFATQFALILPRVASQIASGTVNLAEMVFSRQPDRWQVSKDLSELSAQFSMAGKSVGQDATSDVIAGAGDIASELVRMYTLSAAGTGLSSVFTKGASTASAASSKGLGALVKKAFSVQSAPFIANAAGSYYAEAMEGGANRGQAIVYALAAGTLEGMLEAMSVDNWINNRLGAATVKDMALGGKATLKSLNYGVKAVSLVSSAIGNALEEGTSYVASTLMQKVLYDPSATIETDELSQQALMGGLIGLFGAAAQLPNQTYANSLYEYMSTHGYSTAAADALLAEIKYTEMSQDRREALTKKVSVSGTKALLSTEDYKATVASIDQAALAVDGASRKLADTESKAQADIAAKQGVVDRLTEQINGLPSASTGDVAMEQARLQSELATARDALNKQIEASRQAVDSSRKDLENVRLQSSRAIEKAQDSLDLHFVAMHNVLSPVMDRIVASSSASEVESAANIAEALNDTMASVRAGEMPTTVDTASPLIEHDDTESASNALSDGNSSLGLQSENQSLTIPDLGANTASYVPQQAVSQFFTNTLDKMETDDGMRAVNDAAQEFGLAGTYDIETEKHSMEMARQRLEVAFDDEVVDLRARTAWTGEDMDTAMGILAAYREQGMQSGDMNNYYEWLKVVSSHSTTAGQALQALAKYSRNTVEGMLVEADRNAQNALKKKSPNTQEKIEQETDRIKEDIDNGLTEEITDAVSRFVIGNDADGRQGKRRDTDGATDTEDSNDINQDSAEQMLAQRIINAAKPKTNAEVDVIHQIVRDLFARAKQSPIQPQDNRQAVNPFTEIGRAYSSREQYQDIWNKAMEIVDQIVGEDEVLRKALGGYFTNGYIPEGSERLLNAVYARAKSDLSANISDIIKRSRGNREQARTNIINYVIANSGVSQDGAVALAMEINKLFNDEVAAKTIAYIERLSKSHGSNRNAAKSALQDIEEINNAIDFADSPFMDRIAERLDADLLALLKENGIRVTYRKDTGESEAERPQVVSLADIVGRGTVYTDQQLLHYLSSIIGDTNLTADNMRTIVSEAAVVFQDAVKNEKDAYAESLARKLQQENDTKADMAERLTDLQKTIRAINLGAYGSEIVNDAVLAANGLPVLSASDIDSLFYYTNRAESETDEYMKKVYYQKAAQIVADKSGSTNMEKLRTLRRVLMLLNPKTTIKNSAANLPMFGLETLKDVPGTLIDMLVSKKTGKRTTTAFSKERYVESAKGFKKGAVEAAKDLKYGTQTSFLPGRYEGTRSHAFNGDTWLGNIMNRLDDATSGLMQLGDRMWAQAAFDGRLAELASLGYDTSNPDVIHDAELYALDRVFQNNSALAKRASQARNALGAFGEMVLPFTQTPANIMDKLLDYSPVGLGRALVQLGREGKSGEFNQKLFVDRISRSLTGGGIMALGAALMRAGLLSLGASDQEEAEAMRLAGVQEYSIKLGDSYVSIDWAEPAGSLMLIGAEIARQFGDDRIESEMDVFDSAVDATVTGLNVFFNNSFLSGVADLISGNQSVGEAIVDTVLGSASQYTSSGLSAIGRTLDPYERYTYSPDWLASEARYLLSRFPGVRSTLDVKIGADGKPVKSTSGDTILARLVENMLVPYRSKKETNDATSKELYRLFAAGYDNALLPIAPKRLQGAELTADQRRDLQAAIGTDTYAAAEKVISSNAYKRATDAEREAMLDDAISNAESKAKKAWAKKNLGK